MKPDKILILALGVIILLSAAAAVGLRLFAKDGTEVIITQDGEEIYRLPLSEDRAITIPSEDGGYNTVVIKDGGVSVTEADCPDRICVGQGVIKDSSQPIVCLPHGLVVQVTAEGETDAVS